MARSFFLVGGGGGDRFFYFNNNNRLNKLTIFISRGIFSFNQAILRF